MWNWEQGRLEYFQFDELRKLAKFGLRSNLRLATRSDLEDAVSLPFLPDDPDYPPWRNYARLFQIAMIATPQGSSDANMTALGQLLSQDGQITTDDYLHFLARATTDPSPALSQWDHTATLRYPLLFVLRFLLARATQGHMATKLSQIVANYVDSGFVGDESQLDFLRIIDLNVRGGSHRQARESIRVLAQLSYLTAIRDRIVVSLAEEDAANLFEDLTPILGTPLRDRAEEIERRASLFESVIADGSFEYPASIISDIDEAGFSFVEGHRVRRTHLIIERNQIIRRRFFQERPTTRCDLCQIDTHHSYPWVDRLLEVHHLLPLCSGARTSVNGTVLEDLVANCPSCHRAVHRYYDKWLSENGRLDFDDSAHARLVYEEAKDNHREAVLC